MAFFGFATSIQLIPIIILRVELDPAQKQTKKE
jgi:hypothetical protein